MKNITIGLILLPISAILQSSLLPYSDWQDIFKLDLILILTLTWNIAYRNNTSMYWALIGGLMTDTLSVNYFGTNVISLLFASMLANVVNTKVWSNNIGLNILTSIVGCTVYYITYLIVLSATGFTINWTNAQMIFLTRSILVNASLIILILPIMKILSNTIYQPRIKI